MSNPYDFNPFQSLARGYDREIAQLKKRAEKAEKTLAETRKRLQDCEDFINSKGMEVARYYGPDWFTKRGLVEMRGGPLDGQVFPVDEARGNFLCPKREGPQLEMIPPDCPDLLTPLYGSCDIYDWAPDLEYHATGRVGRSGCRVGARIFHYREIAKRA